jgi:hypothetical protein
MSDLLPDLFQWAATNRFNNPMVEATITVSVDPLKGGSGKVEAQGACSLSYAPRTIFPIMQPASFAGQPFTLSGPEALQQPVVVQLFAPSPFTPVGSGPWPSYQLVISAVVMTGTGPALVPEAQMIAGEDPVDEGTAESPWGAVSLSGGLLKPTIHVFGAEVIAVGLKAI